jgi:Fur family ferric uptake transcriptional regulator
MRSSTQPGIGPTSSPRVLERSTRQRRVIRAVFDDAERPLSIEEVLAAAQRGRKATVSLSTVYRFVRSLVDDGSLSVFELPGQGAFYELAGKEHHHHFSCIHCGRVYELNDCVSVEKLVLPKGFHAVSHDLTVAGVCAACNANGAPRVVRRAQ